MQNFESNTRRKFKFISSPWNFSNRFLKLVTCYWQGKRSGYRWWLRRLQFNRSAFRKFAVNACIFFRFLFLFCSPSVLLFGRVRTVPENYQHSEIIQNFSSLLYSGLLKKWLTTWQQKQIQRFPSNKITEVQTTKLNGYKARGGFPSAAVSQPIVHRRKAKTSAL